MPWLTSGWSGFFLFLWFVIRNYWVNMCFNIPIFHLFCRRRESQSQEDLRNQLQNTVNELEAAKSLKEDMLKDSSTQIEQLRKMMLSHEAVLQEIRSILVDFEEASGKKIYEHDSISTVHFRNMGSAVSKILRELDTEISYLKGRIFPVSGKNTTSKLKLREYYLAHYKKNFKSAKGLLAQWSGNTVCLFLDVTCSPYPPSITSCSSGVPTEPAGLALVPGTIGHKQYHIHRPKH